jgi:hypothetical protein
VVRTDLDQRRRRARKLGRSLYAFLVEAVAAGLANRPLHSCLNPVKGLLQKNPA